LGLKIEHGATHKSVNDASRLTMPAIAGIDWTGARRCR